MRADNSQERAEAQNESWVVAAHRNVLRPGSRCQAEDEDQHGYNEQHHCHDYGFPLPPLKGTHACFREAQPAGLEALSRRHNGRRMFNGRSSWK